MQGLSSDSPAVRRILPALTDLVRRSHTVRLSAQGVGNSLFGLQGMDSARPEVRDLVSVLTTNIERCSELLNSQVISNSCYGLQRMRSGDAEVRRLVRILGEKIRRSAVSTKVPLTSQAFGTSSCGLTKPSISHRL